MSLSSAEAPVRMRKTVLRMFPYGVYVVTARHDGHVAAATIDWVTQASIEPLTMVACLRADSFIRKLVVESGRFGLHVLGEGQKDLAARFFRFQGADDRQINGQAYRLGAAGVPLLEAPPAALELEVAGTLDRADHSVVLGDVKGVHLAREAPALLLRDTGWHYGA